MSTLMERREFITLLGGAATAWPLAARAQQPAIPVIGYLYSGSAEPSAHILAAFHKGLNEMGFVEGRNVTIEFRYANNDRSRIPDLVADLVRRRVAVIAAPGSGGFTALAAKAATATIPIVFTAAGDPVEQGLVASFNRPGGNLTGFAFMTAEIVPKRLGLLHELLPRATRFAMLAAPAAISPVTDIYVKNLNSAAAAIGGELQVLTAATNREIDAAFERIGRTQVDALVVAAGSLFLNRRVQLATLAAHYRIPAIYAQREVAEAGGLMSYGTNFPDQARQVGLYTGRILKGEKPADLPVVQPTKFEFVMNLQTARALRIEVPPGLLAIADEVIE
jgi:putative tryptophan/tyrosine transport system substrate-binding protein